MQTDMDGWQRVDERKGHLSKGAGWPNFPLDQFEVGGGMKGLASAASQARMGLCGLWLSQKQALAVDALKSGKTVWLMGQAGTGKTTVITEWALELEAQSHKSAKDSLDAAAPTHAAGGRLRVDTHKAGAPLNVGTVSARFGLGTRTGKLDASALAKAINPQYAKSMVKCAKGVIDEVFLMTPRRLGVCAEIQCLIVDRLSRPDTVRPTTGEAVDAT